VAEGELHPIGEEKLVATVNLRPNAAGALTQCSRSGGTYNWEMVDEEVQDGDATYIFSPSGQYLRYDYYELGPMPAAISITKITVYGYFRSGAPPQYNLYAELNIRTHGTVYGTGSFWPPQTPWSLNSKVYTTNPFTGVAWTVDEVNALQAGFGLYYGNTPSTSTRCTQVYVEVTYDPIILPSVTTDPATAIQQHQADPNGTLDDDGGEACDCGFEWGETIVYSNTTPTQSRTTGQTFAQIIIGLDPNKTYHFRAFATNSAGTSYGADRTFTTLVAAAAVTTDPATLLTHGEATLNGTLDGDGGEACQCGFEWGETIAYGNTTPPQSRTTGQSFAQPIIGLDPHKTYHFRAFATNSAGTSYGADRSFTTLGIAVPIATTDPANTISSMATTLNGILDDDGGEACQCGFEWGETIAYGNTTPTQSKNTGQTFSEIIAPLDPDTEYHFRAFAINSAGIGYGADRSFRTYPAMSRAYALSRSEL
jgi:ubiquitin